VLEVVRAFELAAGVEIPFEIMPRRPGDIAETWADPGKAKAELGWTAQRDLAAMCVDAWNWQQRNPEGYP
jgi:UDP-glucose 4-epimerase